jgi:hypothetical protein
MPLLEITNQLRPQPLGVSDHHGVEVPRYFIGDERRMVAPCDDGLASAPELPSDLIGPGCQGGHKRDADKVDIGIEVERPHIFVADDDLVAGRCESGDGGEGQDAKAEHVSWGNLGLVPSNTELGGCGQDEEDSHHAPLSTRNWLSTRQNERADPVPGGARLVKAYDYLVFWFALDMNPRLE